MKIKVAVAAVVLVAAVATLAALKLSVQPPAPSAFGGTFGPADNTIAPGAKHRSTTPQPNPNVAVYVAQESIKADPAHSVRLEGIVIASQLDALLAEAKKNPSLAYALAAALSQCSRADRSYKTLSAQVGRLISPKAAGASVEELDNAYAKCAGLTSTSLEQRFDLAAMAARAGVLEAQVNYRNIAWDFVKDGGAVRRPNAVDEYRTNVEAFTVAAARTGDRHALFNAYLLYSDGFVLSPDPVRAYRYLAEFARVNPDPRTQATLARFAGSLTPEQLRQAQRR